MAKSKSSTITAATRSQNRQRSNREVADREASRLARPEIAHNNNNNNNTSSTTTTIKTTKSQPSQPQQQKQLLQEQQQDRIQRSLRLRSRYGRVDFGNSNNNSNKNNNTNNADNNNKDEEKEELWCGPYSVAQQMLDGVEDSRKLREEQLLRQEQERQRRLYIETGKTGGCYKSSTTRDDNNDNDDDDGNGNNNNKMVINHPLDYVMMEEEHERLLSKHPSIGWRSGSMMIQNVIREDDNNVIHEDDDGNDIDNKNNKNNNNDEKLYNENGIRIMKEVDGRLSNVYSRRRKRYERHLSQQQQQHKKPKTSPYNNNNSNNDGITTNTTNNNNNNNNNNSNSSICKVSTLFELATQIVIQNIHSYKNLGGLYTNSKVRKAISYGLALSNQITNDTLEIIGDEGCDYLKIIDCVSLDEDCMISTLERILEKGLDVLNLGNCGRCFTSKAVDVFVSSENNPSKGNDDSSSKSSKQRNMTLHTLALEGAYMLTDMDAKRLINATYSTLTSLSIKACHLMGRLFCEALRECYSSTLSSTSTSTSLLVPSSPPRSSSSSMFPLSSILMPPSISSLPCLLELNLTDLHLSKYDLLSIFQPQTVTSTVSSSPSSTTSSPSPSSSSS